MREVTELLVNRFLKPFLFSESAVNQVDENSEEDKQQRCEYWSDDVSRRDIFNIRDSDS